MTNILLISSTLPMPVYKDGATLRVFFILKTLLELKCKVSFIYLGTDDLGESKLWLKEAGIDHHSFSTKIPFILKLFPQFVLNYFTKRNIPVEWKQKHFDNVICEGVNSCFFDKSVLKTFKITASYVDSISLANLRLSRLAHYSKAKRLKYFFKSIWYYFLEIKFAKNSDLVTVVSEDDKRFLISNIRSSVDVKVIKNGINLEDFPQFARTPYSFEDLRFVFTGVLSSGMNEEAALELVGIFKGVDQVLSIIGRSPTRLIKRELELLDNINLKSDVPDINYELQGFNIFLCPIFSGTGIKNNVLQALSNGLLVVTTSLISTPIGLTHGVNCLVLREFDDLFTLLESYKAEELHGIAANGSKFVQNNFSWECKVIEYL